MALGKHRASPQAGAPAVVFWFSFERSPDPCSVRRMALALRGSGVKNLEAAILLRDQFEIIPGICSFRIGNEFGSNIVLGAAFLGKMQLPKVRESGGAGSMISQAQGEPPFLAPLSIMAMRGAIPFTNAGLPL
jgi:hypothetical protein